MTDGLQPGAQQRGDSQVRAEREQARGVGQARSAGASQREAESAVVQQRREQGRAPLRRPLAGLTLGKPVGCRGLGGAW
ncbi:MAG: hypothetical protein ACRDR6_17685 [Pseudonocardiaceae bacterium]